MLDVIVPMSGPMPFFDGGEFPFPKPLVEIDGAPMVAYLAENLRSVPSIRAVHFLVRDDYCKKFHLDDTLKLLLPDLANVIPVRAETGGALCTALLSIDRLSPSVPLIVANFDQFFAGNFDGLITQILSDSCDGGCAVFESVHPRWSFVRVEGGLIREAAEKKPISRTAIAGLYGFRRAEDFLEGAFRALISDASVDGVFYLSAVLNELVLMGRRLQAVTVPGGRYHTFFSPQRIEQFLRFRASE